MILRIFLNVPTPDFIKNNSHTTEGLTVISSVVLVCGLFNSEVTINLEDVLPKQMTQWSLLEV